MTIRTKIFHWTVVAVLVATCGLLAPAAFAGGHGYGHGQRGYTNHSNYRSTTVHRSSRSHRSRYVSAPRYTRYNRRAPVRTYARPAYGYASYGYGQRNYRHYRSRHHSHVGEVLGAIVAGAVITNLISDAVQPRTTVVERTVYSSDPYNTRYLGSEDDGYYGDPRR